MGKRRLNRSAALFLALVFVFTLVLGNTAVYAQVEADDAQDVSETQETAVSTLTSDPDYDKVSEIYGENRYETMAQIAEETFGESGSTYAVIATGTNFPDALAAASLAGALDAPVILISDQKADEVVEELTDLGVTDAYIIGGTSSVSEDAENKIEEAGIGTKRIAGEDRFDTAVQIAEEVLQLTEASGKETSDTCIVASGAVYSDALSGSPYAYWSASPIYLVKKDGSISTDTLVSIADGGYSNIVVLGGTSSVSEETQELLEEIAGVESVTRLGGKDRYETSQLTAEWSVEQGMCYDGLVIATGTAFPDALAGSALCGQRGSVLLLAAATAEKSSVLSEVLTEQAGSISKADILGGTSSVGEDVREMIREILNSVYVPTDEEMAEFEEKDIDDFEGYEVINFDEDDTTNFAVLDEDAKAVQMDGSENTLLSADDDSGIYVIADPTEDVTGLAEGDIFYYVYGDEDDDYILLKVAAVTVNEDGSATVEAELEDVSISDFFEYVDLEAEQEATEENFTPADTEGIEYLGYTAYEDDDEVKTLGLESGEASDEMSFSFSVSYEFDDYTKVTGTLKETVTGKVKLVYDKQIFGEDYIDFSASAESKTKVSLTYSFSSGDAMEVKSFRKNLGTITIPIATGVDLEGALYYKFSGEVETTVTATTECSLEVGMSYNSETGFSPIAEYDGDADLDCSSKFTVFAGVACEFSAEILKGVVKFTIEEDAGLQLEAKVSETIASTDSDEERHVCEGCFDIELALISETSGKITLVNWNLAESSKLEASYPLLEGYASHLTEESDWEFGWGDCPHKEYAVTVKICDTALNAISGVTVAVSDEETSESLTTGDDGTAVIWLENGTYDLSAVYEDHKGSSEFTVSGAARTAALYLNLNEESVMDEDDGEDDGDDNGEEDGSEDVEEEYDSAETVIPDEAVEFNGHYYYLYDGDDMDEISCAEDAIAYCESVGGYMAAITSEEENTFLYEYITSIGYSNAYFGYSDAEEEGTWVWLNGETSDYTNWHFDEPSNSYSNENYAMFYYKYTDGTWNDGDFGGNTVSGGMAFLCEWGS